VRTRPATPTAEQPLWDVKDVAAFLKISPDLVGIMARRGEIPSKKIGHARRYVPAEIMRWIERAS